MKGSLVSNERCGANQDSSWLRFGGNVAFHENDRKMGVENSGPRALWDIKENVENVVNMGYGRKFVSSFQSRNLAKCTLIVEAAARFGVGVWMFPLGSRLH